MISKKNTKYNFNFCVSKTHYFIYNMDKTIVLIPSRLQASRLPNKPLLRINNKSLIMHVYENAKKSDMVKFM